MIDDHVVYRLRKRKCQNGKSSIALGIDLEKDECNNMERRLQNNIDFAEIVMSPVIRRHFVQAGVLVQLPNHFPKAINKRLKSLDVRPPNRLHQEVDENCLFAQCLPDFCYLLPKAQPNATPVFSVEIKPKCGFIPAAAQTCEDNAIQRYTCSFCMYQYLKIHNGMWHKRSRYCPLDLFSGNRRRMKCALQALFSTPQNNLKMFKNGQVVWSEELQNGIQSDLECFFPSERSGHSQENECSLMDGFVDVLVRCLLHISESSNCPQEDQVTFRRQHCSESTCKSNSDVDNEEDQLPEESVLGCILKGQMLDSLGIEAIYPLYEKVQAHLDFHPEERENFCIDGPYDHQSWKLLSQHVCEKQDSDEESVHYALNKVKEYLISRTAKDCSLMIAIQPMTNKSKDKHLKPTAGVIMGSNGCKYQFSVSVIDLDPKPWDKLPKYFKQDQEIVEFYKLQKDQHPEK